MRSHESSGGSVVVFNRATGWTIAFLLVGVLGGVVYLGTSFFTREHQIEHMEDRMRIQEAQIEALTYKNQELARRIVVLETELESVQGDR